jgi:3-hydroxyacyl-[acyl-carrier-protein] dehydratase
VALSENEDFAGRTFYLLALDKVRFRKPVHPGDPVRIVAEKDSESRGIWKFKVVATVDGVKVADGGVMASVAKNPD